MTEVLQLTIPLVAALGVGGILTKIVDYLLERRTKQSKDERNAWKLLDAESDFRRRYEEALHTTRIDWHKETGKPYKDMPPKPTRDESE